MTRVVVRRTAEWAIAIGDDAAQLEDWVSVQARLRIAMAVDSGSHADLATIICDEMVDRSIRGDRVVAHGPRILLQAKASQTLGLAVRELMDNALKFGALSASNGGIDVAWWIDGPPRPRHLHLRWAESGVPVLSGAPRIAGFGRELIRRTLPYKLAAATRWQFPPGGFRCDLTIPLRHFSRRGFADIDN